MHRGNKLSEYELKKGDIIKFGRTKLLVRDINIVKKHEKIKQKNERIMRHRKGFEIRNKRELRSQSQMVAKKSKKSKFGSTK